MIGLLPIAACGSVDEASAPPDAVPGATAAVRDPRHRELERVDGTSVVQLYADGFEALSLRDKQLAYHLVQAAIAGRDIYIDQRFARGLMLRWVLESLFLVKDELPADVAREVDRYCKLFWVHNGIHDNHSTKKVLLKLGWEQFEAACKTAEAAGHSLQPSRLAPCRSLQEVFAILTDPESFTSVTDKNPEDGGDPVTASCNNLYVGVTGAELEGVVEEFALNSRVMRRADGQFVEQIYRCGDGRGYEAGLYAPQLAQVNEHLRRALPFAPTPTRKALERLIRYNETGLPADWRSFNIAWVQDRDSPVDAILGFVEVYLDVRGIKGSWEAVVSFRDEKKSAEIAAIAAEAQWFEDRMPWDPRFRKAEVKGISARAIKVITETGDSGPITPVGINLPNEADIRQEFGSKSVNLANVVTAYNMTQQKGSAGEFSFTPAEAQRAEQYAAAMDDLHTNLHEVVGHASGQVLPETENPAQRLGLFYSTLEEARADLVGLYWIADPKLREMGLVPNDDAVLAKYEVYTRNALVQLRRVPAGGKIEEDHMRNRQLIVHWLLANQGGVKRVQRDGKTFYTVESIEVFRAGCGRLLAEVMRIKAEGDFAAGKSLVETYGTKVEPALHQEVLGRIAGLNLPSVTGFVQPELRLEKGSDGTVTNVVVEYPCDLADQMLRWSRRRPQH